METLTKKILLLLLIVINSPWASTQQIYLQSSTASGGTAGGSGGSASYAIGQAFFVKNSGTEGTVSQGVIQLLSGLSNPLPITLLSFIAVYNPDENTVDLTWYTAAEINNDYFTIERSHDGLEFSPIGYRAGAGYSNTLLRYDFEDEQPLPGISYYRLKQTDFDGTFDYSPIVAVQIKVFLPNLTVYPNPTSQYLHIRLDNPDLAENTWELLSMNGRLVKRGSFHGEQETVFLADLPDGTWLLRIFRRDFSATLKIIKK